MTREFLIGGKVELRPDEDGKFDELILRDGQDCIVHAEMMSDKSLWIGIYPRGEKQRRVCLWIRSNGKLKVHAAED